MLSTQRGFLLYVGIAAVVAIAGLSIALKVQSSRLESAKAETVSVQGKFDAFVATTKALGEAADKKARAQELADKANKEKVDADHKKTVAALAADIARVRRDRENSRRDIVPPKPPASKCPDGQACFERATLEQTLRDYRSAIRGLVDEGSAVAIDLEAARKWAAEQAAVKP